MTIVFYARKQVFRGNVEGISNAEELIDANIADSVFYFGKVAFVYI